MVARVPEPAALHCRQWRSIVLTFRMNPDCEKPSLESFLLEREYSVKLNLLGKSSMSHVVWLLLSRWLPRLE